MTRDPVSWLVVEPGWEVVGRDGARLGTVHEVLGDSGEDIFSGLAVSPGLLRSARVVPAERVRSIIEGRIEVDVTASEFDALDEAGSSRPSA